MSELDIQIVGAGSAAATRLIAALDADLDARYPGLEINGIDPDEFAAEGGVFLVGVVGGDPVACGAFRPAEGAAEIKRMYVLPEYRGRGIARVVLRHLEAEAVARGLPQGILETGNLQPEAIALYRSEGWREIPCFGKFVDDPRSVCFGKALSVDA